MTSTTTVDLARFLLEADCDLSPNEPSQRPTAMLGTHNSSGATTRQRCSRAPSLHWHTPFSFASHSSSLTHLAVSTTFDPCLSMPLLLRGGRSFSSGGASGGLAHRLQAAVPGGIGAGALTFARGLPLVSSSQHELNWRKL